MLEILSVKGRSVRVRMSMFVFDVRVIYTKGKRDIILPTGAFFISKEHYKLIRDTILAAHGKGMYAEHHIDDF